MARGVKEQAVTADAPASNGNGHRRLALTAAALPLDLSSKEEQKRYLARRQEWQRDAWRWFHEIGEVGNAGQFLNNCLSHVRLFAGRRPEGDDDPVPVGGLEADESQTPDDETAQAAVDRLKGRSGSHGSLLGAMGVNLAIAGEVYLVGSMRRDNPKLPPTEVWEALSTDELVVENGRYVRRTAPGAAGLPYSSGPSEAIDERNTTAIRIWRPDPQWSQLAISPMRAILDRCKSLDRHSKALEAQVLSRTTAGLLLWPNEALPAAKHEGQSELEQQEALIDEFLTVGTTAIHEPAAASAVFPMLTFMAADLIDAPRLLQFDRPLDPVLAERIDNLIQRIANGLDVPAEVLTGLSQTSHWNAWMIDEQTFKSHVEPLIILICDSLTTGYLLPQMAADDKSLDTHLIWYDASELVANPDRSKDAEAAHDRIAISDAALRRYKSFSEEDAPDDDEWKRRALLQTGTVLDPETGEDLNPPAPSPLFGPSDQPIDQESTEKGPPAGEEDSGPDPRDQALAAAGFSTEGRRLAALGRQLATIDRTLLLRLQIEADAAVRRALERAGARVRSQARVSGRDDVQAVLKACADSPGTFLARLGPSLVADVGATEEDMLAGAFEPLWRRWHSAVRTAQRKALALAASVAAVDDAAMAPLHQRQDNDRESGWALFSAALLGLTRNLLYDPAPDVPALGEAELDVLVPAGVVRDALRLAGGSDIDRPSAGDAPPGAIGTGTLVAEVLGGAGIVPGGYVWRVGSPARPFEPHQDLADVTFGSWDDPVLAAPAEADWLSAPFLFPGDHSGCQCIAEPTLITMSGVEEEAA